MPEIIENLVSTIIPVYNRPQMLIEAVDSVLAQTYRSIEIIISDDGSGDETRRVIREMAQTHPNVIRFVLNNNRGAGPAREAGRQLARGEFIQYLDSDDRLLPGKFEVQVKALRERPDCGAAYGYIRLCPENGPPESKPHKWSGRELPTLFPWLLIDRWWNTDCPLLRRSVCDAVGPWADLRYSQDYEYDGRIGALGTRLVHCKEFVCEQRHHDQNRQTGHGGWLEPPDRVRFFNSLFHNAVKAGVSVNTVEMKHFSRWVFLNARQCGAMGDAKAARDCFVLAVKAAGKKGWDFKIYQLMASGVGWSNLGALTCWLSRLLKQSPGSMTQKQSWMDGQTSCELRKYQLL
jgi:glycosyltransferase involved in cell wall biosynthesis